MGGGRQVLRHPWFTSGLPAGVVEMNATCLGLQHEADGWALQTDAQIRAVVAAAKIPSLRSQPPPPQEAHDSQVPILPSHHHTLLPLHTHSGAQLPPHSEPWHGISERIQESLNGKQIAQAQS